jgi:hypothetical protein
MRSPLMDNNLFNELTRLAEMCREEKEFLHLLPAFAPLQEAERIVALEFTSLSRFYAWVWQNKNKRDKTRPPASGQKKQELTKAERDALIKELEARLFELDELEKTIIPNLLDIYHLKVGIHELELLRLEYENRKTLSMISAIREALGRGEKPDIDEIEKSARANLSSMGSKIKESQKKIERSRLRSSSLMSPENSREFKKLYRTLVNRLHPDLHSPRSDRQKELWTRMQHAYSRGDIEELRLLDLLAGDLKEAAPPAEESHNPYESVSGEDLKSNLAEVKKKIDELKDSFPLKMKDQLLDRQWIEEQVHTTGKKIDDELKLREMCQATLKGIKKALEK